MHYFLTGEKGIGKSLLLTRTLELLGLPFGGFRTGFGPECQGGLRQLYMHRADEAANLTKACPVAVFHGYEATAYPEKFDELGCKYLEKCSPLARIIVMDELGKLERQALAFQAAVLRILDGNIPVLGVIRRGFPSWTADIAARPDVCVFTVTMSNRNELPGLLSEQIRRDRAQFFERKS